MRFLLSTWKTGRVFHRLGTISPLGQQFNPAPQRRYASVASEESVAEDDELGMTPVELPEWQTICTCIYEIYRSS